MSFVALAPRGRPGSVLTCLSDILRLEIQRPAGRFGDGIAAPVRRGPQWCTLADAGVLGTIEITGGVFSHDYMYEIDGERDVLCSAGPVALIARGAAQQRGYSFSLRHERGGREDLGAYSRSGGGRTVYIGGRG